mgnify:FL=1
MIVTVYETRNIYGEWYETFDAIGEPVGVFELEDTPSTSFELVHSEFGTAILASDMHCTYQVIPIRDGARYFVAPADPGDKSPVAWLKEA